MLAAAPKVPIIDIGSAIFGRRSEISWDHAQYSPLPTGPYWGLLMPTVMSVSTWSPVSSGLSACYCLDRHCVFRSLATPR
jgi:hypothetical protein